jgi:putative endonuclease
MYFVYILQSVSTGRFYIGQCDHLIERFHEHQRGVNSATRGPWRIAYFAVYETRTEALKREAQIKRKKSSTSIRRMIARACEMCGVSQTGLD